MKSKLQLMLDQRAKTYETYAENEKDKFTKGFFEGKAEQARQTIKAIGFINFCLFDEAADALNGDN